MRKIVILLLAMTCFAQPKTATTVHIDAVLNQWHKAASESNFTDYFKLMTPNAVFIGTDATENWTKTAFMRYAKPYFDQKKGWHFTALQRNIYLSKDAHTAWFDELLSTQMKICRGSGVLVKTKFGWQIQHYVLSMTIPNNTSAEITKIKAAEEDALMLQMQKL